MSEYGSAIFPLLRDQAQQLGLIPITVAAVCTILTLAHSDAEDFQTFHKTPSRGKLSLQRHFW